MFKDMVKRISEDLSFRILDKVKVEHSHGFTPNSFQLFPERYINAGNNVLCIDYDMGSGKTLSAALAISGLINDVVKIEQELIRTGNTAMISKLPRPYVVGNWSSVEAFEDEFMRPVFGIFTDKEYADYLARSDDSIRPVYTKRIHRLVRMMSYQKLFNRYFRGSIQLTIKDEDTIAEALKSGEIVIDRQIASELSGSYIIVDEVQLLYSSAGWNTYGILLDHIRQNVDDLTTILLSGTFINSSPVEMVHLYNLIRDKGSKRIKVTDYFVKELVNEIVYVYTPSKDMTMLFDGKVVSYRVSPSKDYPRLELGGKLLPKFHWLKLEQCQSSEYQWKQFIATYKEDEDDQPAHDFATPPKDVTTNDWMKVENLRTKYGAIPARFIDFLHDIIKKKTGEKVAAHHRRLERGGLLQYAEALSENGITEFGQNPRDDALCILCGKELAHHAEVEIAKKKNIKVTDHQFVPATFAILTGRTTISERRNIVNTYNSSANLGNRRIMCILLSGVGERGITLKATNYAVSLGGFPGLPSWRQFISRVRRHATHTLLPPEKRFVRVYTMVLSSPDGTPSIDEFRYFLRERNDAISLASWNKVRLRTPNCPFIPPENRGTHDTPVKCAWELGKDISRERFDTLYGLLHLSYVRRVIKDAFYITPIWSLKDLRLHIVEDRARIVPHNMTYTKDETIATAIADMIDAGEANLMSKTGELVKLENIRRSDVYLINGARRRGPLALSIFFQHQLSDGVRWAPISGTTEDMAKVFDQMHSTNGYRERVAVFDRVIGKTGFIDLVYKDFEDEGPIYNTLLKAGCIVWAGDDEGCLPFAQNRLTEKKKKIGFLLGNEYHRPGSEMVTVPFIDASNSTQWTICAIFSAGTAPLSGRWHARTKIRPIPSSVEDQRKAQSGMACISLPPATISEYAKLLQIKEESKTKCCAKIEEELLKRQLSKEGRTIRFIYTPFEIPPSEKK